MGAGHHANAMGGVVFDPNDPLGGLSDFNGALNGLADPLSGSYKQWNGTAGH